MCCTDTYNRKKSSYFSTGVAKVGNWTPTLRGIQNKYEFVSSSHAEIRYKKKIIKDYSNCKPPVGAHQTWLYTANLVFFERNINCWRRTWNRIHDFDVQDRMTKVGLNFGYLKDVTYTAKPRPDENEIGIRAIRKNEEYYKKRYKFI